MSQYPTQPPQPQWDPQRGQWFIPESQQSRPSTGTYGQAGPSATSPGEGRYNQQPFGVPGHVPPPPPPPKKSKKWPWIVGGLVVLLIIIIASTSGGGSSAPTSNAAESATPAASPSAGAAAPADASSAAAGAGVVYTVTGSGRANNITYGEASKGISQANGERLPWTKSTPSTEGFAIYSLTAQNGGSGEIICSITVNGKEIATNSSSGQYAVVTCNGTTSPF